MPNISFASGGDSDKLDFVAYVAKNRQNVRSCYVLECSGGLSQDVITTIGQAFELRLDAKLTYLVMSFFAVFMILFFFSNLLIKINHQNGYHSDFKGDCSARNQLKLRLSQNGFTKSSIFQKMTRKI